MNMFRPDRPSLRAVWHGAAFVAAMIPSTMSLAQKSRSTPPPPAPAPEINVAPHHTFVLDNGMRVIVVENRKVPLVSVQLKFDIEPFSQGDLAGYAELTGELLTSGTNRRTKSDLDDAIDGLGASMSTGKDGLYAQCLKRNLGDLMNIIYEVTTSATFPSDEFDKARTRYISALQQQKEDADAVAGQVGRALTFGSSHPYGEMVTERSLAGVKRKHVMSYYQRFFRPEKAYMVLVGDINEQEARNMLARTWSSWKPEAAPMQLDDQGNELVDGLGSLARPRRAPEPRGGLRVAVVDRPNAPQSVIRVVHPVRLHPGDPRAVQAQVMNAILGGGVFNARLMQNLREDKGFTYGAYSSLSPDKHAGSFTAMVSVRTEVTDSAIVEILDEMAHIREKPVSQSELELAKRYLAGSFARSLEDPRTVARFALNTYMLGLAPDHYDTYLQRLDTVTTAGVQAAANDFIAQDKCAVLVVGDKQRIASSLSIMNAPKGFTQLDAEGKPWRESITPVANMTVEDVLEAYFKAIGGRDAMDRVRDLHVRMKGTMQGMPVVMDEWKVKPSQHAVSIMSGNIPVHGTVYNGLRGIRTGPDGTNEVIEMDLEEMELRAKLFPETGYHKLGRLLLNGLVDVGGRPCYKITLMNDNGTSFSEYFDKETGLKFRREEGRFTEHGVMTVSTTFRDHREVDGIQFPHLIEQDGLAKFVLMVEEVKINEGVSPLVFEIDHEE